MRVEQKGSPMWGWRRGFTLTEILVATGLAAVVLGVVMTVMGLGGEGYARTTARVDANVEARTALRTLADDVASLRFDDSFGARAANAGRPLNELWFSAWKPRMAQELSGASGDLCFAYYYTAVTRPLEGATGPFTRKLYRRLVSSAEVMSRLKAGESLDEPEPNPAARADEAIAFNVVQFLAEPVVLDEEGSQRVWTNGDSAPTHFRVTLGVIDNKTAGALITEEDWEGRSALARQLLGAPGDESDRIRTFKMIVPVER